MVRAWPLTTGVCMYSYCPGLPDALWSLHPGGVNVMQGDGSIRFVKDTINQAIWYRSIRSAAARSSRPTRSDGPP